jgi:hypothetical protein
MFWDVAQENQAMFLKLKRTAICVTALLSFGPLAFAKDKARDWQPGTLLESSTDRGSVVPATPME